MLPGLFHVLFLLMVCIISDPLQDLTATGSHRLDSSTKNAHVIHPESRENQKDIRSDALVHLHHLVKVVQAAKVQNQEAILERRVDFYNLKCFQNGVIELFHTIVYF